jgi:hypothetical protein
MSHTPCPEHRCKILREQRLWARYRAGEFRLRTETKARNPPTPDYKGRPCSINQQNFLLDDTYPPKHPRHVVLRSHCFRQQNGAIGASGLIDPKEITIGDINYRQLANDDPHCELCEGGDMIALEDRFDSSKYKPLTVPQPIWRRTLGKIRRQWNRLCDQWSQRGIGKLLISLSLPALFALGFLLS